MAENSTWHGDDASAVEWANAITRAVPDDDTPDPICRIASEVAGQLGALVIFVSAVGDDKDEVSAEG